MFLSAAEREAGTVVHVEHSGRDLKVRVPPGVEIGTLVRVRHGDSRVVVEICDRPWGVDGNARLDLAPSAGPLLAAESFWSRAVEELVESRRAGCEFGGAVYAEQAGSCLVLTGLNRRQVGGDGPVHLDRSWGSLLWHTSTGVLAGGSPFDEEDARLARQLERPLITIVQSTLSPALAANLLFPWGVRPLMLASGIKGMLALDRWRKGPPWLLGRAVAARVVYPAGEVQAVTRVGASLPREVYDRAAFAVDRSVGKARTRARRFLNEVMEMAATGKPPGA